LLNIIYEFPAVTPPAVKFFKNLSKVFTGLRLIYLSRLE